MWFNHRFLQSLLPLSSKYYLILNLTSFPSFAGDVHIKLEISLASDPTLFLPLGVILFYTEVIKIFHYYHCALFLRISPLLSLPLCVSVTHTYMHVMFSSSFLPNQPRTLLLSHILLVYSTKCLLSITMYLRNILLRNLQIASLTNNGCIKISVDSYK